MWDKGVTPLFQTQVTPISCRTEDPKGEPLRQEDGESLSSSCHSPACSLLLPVLHQPLPKYPTRFRFSTSSCAAPSAKISSCKGVCVCMCHVRVYMHMCAFTCACVCACMHVWGCVCVYVCACMYACACVCMCTCACVSVYVCVFLFRPYQT